MGKLYEAVETFISTYRERYRRVDGAINRNAPMREQVAALNSALHDAARSEAQPSGYDGGKSLGERFQDALFAGFGTGMIPAAYRVMPFGQLPAEHQVAWNRAALTFTASLSDASPSSGDE